MNIFLVQGADHYLNLVTQQVAFPELKEYEGYKEMLTKREALAGACCATRAELTQDLNQSYETLVTKITQEDTGIAEKLATALHCKKLIFACYDLRNNIQKEIEYERKS